MRNGPLVIMLTALTALLGFSAASPTRPRNPSASIAAAVRPVQVAAASPQAAPAPRTDAALFRIGSPDHLASEFGCADRDYTVFTQRFAGPVVYTVGRSTARDWPFIHPSTKDAWAGGSPHTFTIRFDAPAAAGRRWLHIGWLSAWEPSRITVGVNGAQALRRRLPETAQDVSMAVDPMQMGEGGVLTLPLPEGAVRPGANQIAITLDQGSWMVYDFIELSDKPNAPAAATPDIVQEALAGPMAGVPEAVFVVRKMGNDGHWYANFAYDANDPNQRMYNEGARLLRLDLRTGKTRPILTTERGGIRDPQVSYDGSRILFSYRPGGTEHYHLYEIAPDGSGLRQITEGPFDDFEPSYLPDGGIAFISSRSRRWVNCWRTPVATLYRCDDDGQGIRPISANIEHDNTPWPMPDGRLLYTRWEYIDRSQVHYHHLWSVNPDGTGHTVYYGNQMPGVVMIDAKPVPGTDKVVCIYSPGHGQMEHDGEIRILSPNGGPDDPVSSRRVAAGQRFRDPWAFTEECIMAASGDTLVVGNGRGGVQQLYRLPPAESGAGYQCQEPRPLVARRREFTVTTHRLASAEPTGKFMLSDVYAGRKMAGVRRGEIASLMVMESLPKPVNFTGGMEPLSYGGTFTLERILGTVPVASDGSAFFEAPALRSLFFIALDKQGSPVKRMQSFASLAPGETQGCVGCHERRSLAPTQRPAAMSLPPAKIAPIAGVPDIYDYPRDIQPIWDRHCVSCHSFQQRAGRIVLEGDRGPLYSQSYFALFARSQVSDGRNRPLSNYPPRTLGSVASVLMAKLDGTHHGAALNERERLMVRLWIDCGAPYPGTYAALGTGMVGGYVVNQLDRRDLGWPQTQRAMAAQQRRCGGCHTGLRALPGSVSDDQGLQPWIDMSPDDPRRTYANHLLYNLTRPALSPLLLAPLSKSAGGWGRCGEVFADTNDADYRAMLDSVAAAGARLAQIKRFDMPGFRPHPGWIREMQRYGVLPATLDAAAAIDMCAAERRYWEAVWFKPEERKRVQPGGGAIRGM
jgi:hypothetical protein